MSAVAQRERSLVSVNLWSFLGHKNSNLSFFFSCSGPLYSCVESQCTLAAHYPLQLCILFRHINNFLSISETASNRGCEGDRQEESRTQIPDAASQGDQNIEGEILHRLLLTYYRVCIVM